MGPVSGLSAGSPVSGPYPHGLVRAAADEDVRLVGSGEVLSKYEFDYSEP